MAVFSIIEAHASSKIISLQNKDSWTPPIPSTASATNELGYMVAQHASVTKRYGNSVAEPYRHSNVGVRVFVDRRFSSDESRLLKKASGLFIKYYLDDAVISCAVNNADKEIWTKRRFENELLYLFRKYNDTPRRRRLYITSFYHANTGASAQANIAVFTTPDYAMEKVSRKNYFHINVNAAQLGEQDDPNVWAGVIAHEILHNLGFRHPTYNRTGRRVDFTYTYGDCLTSVARSR